MQIDPDVLERVRQIDLLSYLREFEPSNLVKVKGTSNVYCTAEHDSLKISNGKWYWWSRGFGGYSALDYLIKVKEYDFVEAVEILTGQTMADWKPPPAPKKDEPKVLLLPPKNKDCNRVIQYLFGRGIDYQLIQECISDGTLYESADYHNAVFIGKDESGTPKYAALRSTLGSTFKQDASGSDKRYSFRLLANKPTDTVHLFEAAIDLLSYATYLKYEGKDYSILKEEKKTKGKARLTNMLRSGKELKVFTVKNGDLKKFTQEAKKYGVLYCVLADRGNKDPNAEVDVIARAEDASKISRIAERFKLASENTASIVTEAEKSKEEKTGQPEPDIGVQEKAEKDKLLDELMGKPVQKEENAQNPSVAKTEKSPQSEPISEQPKKSAEGAIMTKDEKPSVREELRKIKESRKEQEAATLSSLDKSSASDRAKKQPAGKSEHKQPQRKKKKPKSKETR